MTPRRARLVLVLVVLGVVGMGVFAWEPVSLWLLTVETPFVMQEFGLNLRGIKRVTRWGDPGYLHGTTVTWHVETGFLRSEEAHSFGRLLRATVWYADGRVNYQIAEQMEKQTDPYSVKREPPRAVNQYTAMRIRREPPWLWNVTDQTAPSMPTWRKDDEQWQRALDAQD